MAQGLKVRKLGATKHFYDFMIDLTEFVLDQVV